MKNTNLNFLTSSDRVASVLREAISAMAAAGVPVPAGVDALLSQAAEAEGSELHAVAHRWKYGCSVFLVRLEAGGREAQEGGADEEVIGRRLMTRDPSTFDISDVSVETVDSSGLYAEELIDLRGVVAASD